ncbi:peroxiredoxin [Streptomyces caniscabiei]|nr:peroxiredoxin [Streptomyces caniscabiei]MDX3729383.1 peroxiredoxin [Streptomyces caniscabiei]
MHPISHPTHSRSTLLPAAEEKRQTDMARGIQVGDKAPDFTLLSQAGAPVRLYDRLGDGVVVLYFYPKDETRGCTAEACAFRDSHEVFTDAGAEVIGVSSDSVHKHAAFAARHNLPFTLLSDEEGQVRKNYGVPSVLGIIPGRVTYVIDRQGTVRHVFNSLTNMDKHVDDALDVVRNIQTADPV